MRDVQLRIDPIRLVVAIGLLACVSAQAGVVQLDMSADFNADLVVNDGSGMNDPTQDAIDLGVIPTGNYCFPTQSVANNSAVAPQTPDGLPDDGFFPAGFYHPDVQLSWNNDDDGLNGWRLASATGSLRIDVPPGVVLEFHLFATSGDGATQVDLTPIYDDGLGAVQSFTVPDWFTDPVEDPTRYVLINDLDRMQPGSGPGTVFEYSDRNAAAIFGIAIQIDPARNLLSVKIDRTDVDGVLDVFGAIAVTDEPPEACCLPDGSCEELGPSECSARGGISQGPGSDCVTTACEQPEACCLRDGTCEDIPPSECLLRLGAPSGPGSTCATIVCATEEACCLVDGSCFDLLPTDCLVGGGSPQGPGSDCAGTACALPGPPGWAPNGADRMGTPLSVAKSGATDLALAWGEGCSPDALDYTVHGGLIGNWYDHEALLCDTLGALVTVTVPSGAGSRYFLVVPVTATEEGSYGLDSFGVERPPSSPSTCLAIQTLGCP